MYQHKYKTNCRYNNNKTNVKMFLVIFCVLLAGKNKSGRQFEKEVKEQNREHKYVELKTTTTIEIIFARRELAHF